MHEADDVAEATRRSLLPDGGAGAPPTTRAGPNGSAMGSYGELWGAMGSYGELRRPLSTAPGSPRGLESGL
eukprot:1576790-Prymnesium_polylepis.1